MTITSCLNKTSFQMQENIWTFDTFPSKTMIFHYELQNMVCARKKKHLSFSCDFNLIYSELLKLYTHCTKEKEQ